MGSRTPVSSESASDPRSAGHSETGSEDGADAKVTDSKRAKPRREKPAENVPAVRGASYSEWKIAGVSQETRTAVKRAAHKEGLSVGAWVDKTLYSAAIRTIKGGPPLLALPPDLLSSLGEMSHKLDRIDERLNKRLSRVSLPVEGVSRASEDFRKRASQVLHEMHQSTSHVADSVVEHTDSTVSEIKRISNSAIERIREATESALEKVGQESGSERQKTDKIETSKDSSQQD